MNGYALWNAAREVQTVERQNSLCERFDSEVISDSDFRFIVQAMSAAWFGAAVLTEQDVQIKLFADWNIGNSLVVLFNPTHALEDANLCAHMAENAHSELQEEIGQNILHGQYASRKRSWKAFASMTDERVIVTVEQNATCYLDREIAFSDTQVIQSDADQFNRKISVSPLGMQVSDEVI